MSWLEAVGWPDAYCYHVFKGRQTPFFLHNSIRDAPNQPAVIDEVQRVPELALAIKASVDRNPEPPAGERRILSPSTSAAAIN